MVSPAGSLVDLNDFFFHSQDSLNGWEGGLLGPCYSAWDTDHTLTEAQKNFLGTMMAVGCGGILFSVSLVAFGVPAHAPPSEHPTIYTIAGGGMLVSLVALCCLKPLKHIFYKWNQSQTVPVPRESSPLLAEV